MERFRYDRSSKWLIEHHGDSMLRLAGVEDVVAWKALPAEVVQPRQLPDGLLEVQRRSRVEKDLYLVEIETYADRQIDEQVLDDVMLIYQSRRVVPGVVLLILRPKGQAQVLGEREVASPSGRTRMSGRWPVVELWKVPAEPLLALRDPGLAPWISLMESAQPPEETLKECRAIIDERAKPEELGDILAVSQVLASLRYNDQWLFNFFGGKEAMIESPYLNQIIDEQVKKKINEREEQVKKTIEGQVRNQMQHALISRILKIRFGSVPADLVAALQVVTKTDELDSLADWAESCTDLAAFKEKLPK
jgi:hypothetical protein